jgi:glutaredoxin
MEPPRVRMYSRRTCGLCDEARAVIQGVRREVPFEFEEVLIDGDDRLERDYGVRIPVVVVDGREEFEIRVDPQHLRDLVKRRA